MDKIVLFIPVYNCEKQLPRVIAEIDDEVLSYVDRVLLVENRSTDHTLAAAKRCIDENPRIPFVLMQNKENYGYGGSVKVAFRYALAHQYSHVIILHGDAQGSVKDILPVLRSGIHHRYDCCLGSRFMKGSSRPGYSAFRVFGNRVFNILFSFACTRRIHDLGSGLNIFQSNMLRGDYYAKFPDDLSFQCCMDFALRHYRQTSLFFPITWREDDQVSNVKLVSQTGKTLRMLLSFMLSPAKFMAADQRGKLRDGYESDVIIEN